jgi:hypothetical protein
MVISGIMPRWQRNIHALGFWVMCVSFAGIGLLSVRFLIQSVGSPAAEIPGARGLFLSGLVMTVLTLSGIGAQVWFRRRLVKEFSYDGSVLRFSTLGAPEAQTRNISEIAEIADWRGRGGAQGYRLRFLDGQKIYLQYSVTNSFAVAEEMRRAAMRQ